MLKNMDRAYLQPDNLIKYEKYGNGSALMRNMEMVVSKDSKHHFCINYKMD